MKFITLLICIGLLIFTHTSGATDYTGIWKRDCSDYHGVRIAPADNQSYSVSFCGLTRCFEPGEWTPNTRIEGDPEYEIISPEKLKIGVFDYTKCTNDPTWIIAEPKNTEPEEPPDCSFDTTSKEDGVIIAWFTDVREFTEFGQGIGTHRVTVGPFRPITLLSKTTIKETSGATIHKGQPFWRVLSPASRPFKLTSVGSFFDYLIDERCVYFGTFAKAGPPLWTLLSSKPLPGVFRAPTPKDIAKFYRLNTTCLQQGDYAEGESPPPCVRPKLLAVTDINRNGKSEYWATEPYRWDTGLTVWENTDNTLVPLLKVCVGCSD